MGIYLKGVSLPTDRDMAIIIRSNEAARIEDKKNWEIHMVGIDDAYEVDEKHFVEIYKAMVRLP